MGFTNLRNVETIRSFEEAEYYFSITEKPRSWSFEERPLKDTRSTHYVLRRRDADTYAVRLYGTEVIRYHRPDADGKCRIEVLLTGHQATKLWIWKHLGLDAPIVSIQDTEGSMRLVGIPYGKHASLVFDAARRLVVAESTAAVLSRQVTSDVRKAARKALSSELDPYVMIAYYAALGRSDTGYIAHLGASRARWEIAQAIRLSGVDSVPPELWGQAMTNPGATDHKKAIGNFKGALVNEALPLRDTTVDLDPFPLASETSSSGLQVGSVVHHEH